MKTPFPIVVLVLAGCSAVSPPGFCSAATCPDGCCDETSRCRAPSATTCGPAGGACTTCGTGELCVANACSSQTANGGGAATGGGSNTGGGSGTAGGSATGGGTATGGGFATGGGSSTDAGQTTICGTADEWVPYPTSGTVTLTCPTGQTILSVSFASYGTPTGTCGAFAASTCDAPTSVAVVESACVGRTSCSLTDFDTTFSDPCSGVSKRLYVQVVCGPGDVNDAGVVNLIVIHGESNAAGMALNSDATPVELAPRPNVKILNNDTLAFETLQVGVNNSIQQNTDGLQVHGMELGLANEVDANRLSRPTYLVKVGSSGARIDQWLQNGTPQNSEMGWGPLTARMDAAVAWLQSHGIPFKITVWQSIGINDYNAGTSIADYTARMVQFRSDFRARYGQNIPFLTTLFFASHPYDPAIQMIADDDPLHLSSAIFTDDALRPDGAHWDYAGLKLIAGRMVDGT